MSESLFRIRYGIQLRAVLPYLEKHWDDPARVTADELAALFDNIVEVCPACDRIFDSEEEKKRVVESWAFILTVVDRADEVVFRFAADQPAVTELVLMENGLCSVISFMARALGGETPPQSVPFRKAVERTRVAGVFLRHRLPEKVRISRSVIAFNYGLSMPLSPVYFPAEKPPPRY